MLYSAPLTGSFKRKRNVISTQDSSGHSEEPTVHICTINADEGLEGVLRNPAAPAGAGIAPWDSLVAQQSSCQCCAPSIRAADGIRERC